MRGQRVVAIWLGRLARTAIRAILPVLAALPLSGGAGAQTHAAFGPNGDHQNPDQCPSGAYPVGFKVKSGDSLNQIAIICAPVDGAGHMGAQWVGPPRGYTDTLKTRLPIYLATLPATHDPRIDQITIAQLLRLVSGIRVDPTVPPWGPGISNIPEAAEAFASKAFATPLGAAPGTTPISTTTSTTCSSAWWSRRWRA